MPQYTEPPTYRVGQVVTIDDQAYLSLPIHLGVVVQAVPEDGRQDLCQVAALKNDSRFGMQVRTYVLHSGQISPADFRPTIYESETYNSMREHAGYPATDEFIRAIHRFLFAVYARRFLTMAERYRENTICNQIRVGDRYRIPLGSLTSGVYRVTEVCGGTAVGITPNSSDEPSCAEFAIDDEGTFYVSARSLSVRGSRITGWEAESPPRGVVFPPPPSQVAGRHSEHRCDESCYDNGCEYNEATRPLSDTNPDDEDYYGDDYDITCDCSSCRPRASATGGRDTPGYINEYSYKPKPIFFGKGSGLYLGSELEIETGSFMPECARTVSAHLGRRAYMKFDGSISSGFEIVTHPMTFAWVAEHFPARELFEELRDRGAHVTGNCGLHVHVSRAGFETASHAYKWLKLLYRNHSVMATLARRDSNQWASWNPTTRRYAKWFAKGAMGTSRYTAVNCTNQHTYEVRIFAATLNPTKYLASLGLVDATARYAREIDSSKIIKARAWEWPALKSWIMADDRYEALQSEIQRLGV